MKRKSRKRYRSWDQRSAFGGEWRRCCGLCGTKGGGTALLRLVQPWLWLLWRRTETPHHTTPAGLARTVMILSMQSDMHPLLHAVPGRYSRGRYIYCRGLA